MFPGVHQGKGGIVLSCAELPAAITAAAVALAQGKSPEEIQLLGALFMQLGDTLATIAAQQALCESRKQTCS